MRPGGVSGAGADEAGLFELTCAIDGKTPRSENSPPRCRKSSPILITNRAAAPGTRAGFRDHAPDHDHGRSPRSGQRRLSVIMPGSLITEYRTCRPRTDGSPGVRTLRHDAGKGSVIESGESLSDILRNTEHAPARRPGGPAARRPGGPAARRPGGPAAGGPAARRQHRDVQVAGHARPQQHRGPPCC